MARVTSKRQVTIPKAIADQYEIAAGDEIEFVPAGDAIRIERARAAPELDHAERLERFDHATLRQQRRQSPAEPSREDRGWRREDLYARGRAR